MNDAPAAFAAAAPPLSPGQDDGGAARAGEDGGGHPRLPQERAARRARHLRNQDGGGVKVRRAPRPVRHAHEFLTRAVAFAVWD